MAGRDFDEIADELYGLPLKDFTPARTAAVTQARQDGDPDRAKRIGELRKPTVVGWLANQLVRAHPDEIRSLVELGATLRDAMRRLAGDELRRSAGQQQQAVYALVQQARAIGEAAGQAVSEETRRGLSETLHAALADPQVADELAAGRLTGALSRSGFLDLGFGTAEPAAPRRTQNARPAPDKQEARAEAEATAEAFAEAQRAVANIEQAVRAARERVERLRDELDQAVDGQARAEADLRRARRDMRDADQAARRAAHRLTTLLDRP